MLVNDIITFQFPAIQAEIWSVVVHVQDDNKHVKVWLNCTDRNMFDQRPQSRPDFSNDIHSLFESSNAHKPKLATFLKILHKIKLPGFFIFFELKKNYYFTGFWFDLKLEITYRSNF